MKFVVLFGRYIIYRTHRVAVFTTAGALRVAEAAKKYLPKMQLRGDWSDGDIDFEESFYLLNKTLCPAVLSENGFMTNEQECRWLQTREARQAITDLHVEGIIEYLEGMADWKHHALSG